MILTDEIPPPSPTQTKHNSPEKPNKLRYPNTSCRGGTVQCSVGK